MKKKYILCVSEKRKSIFCDLILKYYSTFRNTDIVKMKIYYCRLSLKNMT